MKRDQAEYLGKLVRLGCIACRKLYDAYEPPDPSLQMTVIHHPREGQGMGQRAHNWLAIPLCIPHHTGATGVHQNGNRIPALLADEVDLLAWTIELYHLTYGV